MNSKLSLLELGARAAYAEMAKDEMCYLGDFQIEDDWGITVDGDVDFAKVTRAVIEAVLPYLSPEARATIARLEGSIGDVAENAVELADRAERAEAENALLRVALDDLVGAIRNSSKGSMGAMNNVYLPQINIIWLEELYGRAVPVPKEQQG